MTLIAFDTLEYAQSLQRAGIPQKDAEAFARANSDAFRNMLSQQDLATKADLEKLRLELTANLEQTRAELNANLEKTRAELNANLEKTRAELNANMEKTRAELNANMEKTREENKTDMAKLEATLTRHTFNMLLAFAGAIGAFFAIAAFFLKS